MVGLSLAQLNNQVSTALTAFEDEIVSGTPFEDARLQLIHIHRQLQADNRVGAQRLCGQIERRLRSIDAEITRVTDLYQAMYDAAGISTYRSGAHTLTLDKAQGGTAPLIVGIDEVGRGPLAGPLTVAAVILPHEPRILYLNDSKQLRPAKRVEVAARIAQLAEGIAIEHIEPSIIDEIGISNALRMGMRRSLAQLQLSQPYIILIDGNPIYAFSQERCIVHGDARIASIAAASIVAKVARDDLMIAYDAQYPGYCFASSKGYGSADHIAALQSQGFTPIHRRSFCRSIRVAQ